MDNFLPLDDKAKDGFERMLRFPDDEHWGWFNKNEGRWYYRPYIGPQYQAHPGVPTHYRPQVAETSSA